MHLKTDTSSQSHFAQVPSISKSRNSFSMAEKHVTTIGFDYLYPIFHKFIYPGDTIAMTEGLLARLHTQIGPLYDDLYLDLHAWFVPFRLLDPQWARFQFNQQNYPAQDNSALVTPKIDFSVLTNRAITSKSLFDYFDMPTLTGVPNDEHINAFLPLAYNLIWNQNYRDENLQDPVVGPDMDPAKTNTVYDARYFNLLKRGKRHDIFTSCLPFQQKGTAPLIPLLGTAPVTTTHQVPNFKNATDETQSGFLIQDLTKGLQTAPPFSDGAVFGHVTGLQVQFAGTLGITIQALRQSIAVQHILEADARGGTRDVEAIQNRWGVTVPDFRLQRPEYLGGQTFSFDGHIVPQTSATTDDSPQGNLAQFSDTLTHFNITHSFQEHGVMMILISARSNITYQQGLAKELSYKTRFDFYQPEFSNLGEVAVKNKEIFFQDDTGSNNNPFGYNEYGYELRYTKNRVSAEMRSNYAQSLDVRHMADDYLNLPSLNGAWIQNNTPIDRNLAVSQAVGDPIELSLLATGKISRTLPMYSVPGLTRL